MCRIRTILHFARNSKETSSLKCFAETPNKKNKCLGQTVLSFFAMCSWAYMYTHGYALYIIICIVSYMLTAVI